MSLEKIGGGGGGTRKTIDVQSLLAAIDSYVSHDFIPGHPAKHL
jgi:hypothetical protein